MAPYKLSFYYFFFFTLGTYNPEGDYYDSKLLFVPCIASHSFTVAAPTIWNSIPLAIHSSVSTHSFRCQLKTYFYKTFCPASLTGVPQQQTHLHSGLATLPSVGAIP